MPSGKKLAWGSYGGETPLITPVDRNMQPRMEGGKPVIIDRQDVIEVKLQEGIDQFVVFGRVKFTDRGKFRIANLMKEGYDYLRMKLFTNRGGGSHYGNEYVLMMEILNGEGFEHGHLVGGGYDVNELVVAQYPGYRNLQVWKVSKGYHDKKISEIVEDIFDKFLNTNGQYSKFNRSSQLPTIEPTSNQMESFCIPFWSPAKTINYLKRYALASGEDAGYHSYFDLKNQFNFRSLQSIMKNGDTHDLELRDVVVTTIQEGQFDSQKIVKEYYPDFVHKEFYKIGLSGASSERFNWFKKKQYTLKNGYLARPLENGPNIIFEKPEEINNMFGFHIPTGYRWEQDKPFCKALVYNQMLTAIAAQVQTKVQINGIVGEKKMKSGDRIIIKNKVQGINENVEELEGRWFVRGVSHSWSTKGTPYRQTLSLSRIGPFNH